MFWYLTVGFERNVATNSERTQRKPLNVWSETMMKSDFINLSIGALGAFGKLCESFTRILDDLNVSKIQSLHMCKTIANISARCTYYIFCRRNKDWHDVELLDF